MKTKEYNKFNIKNIFLAVILSVMFIFSGSCANATDDIANPTDIDSVAEETAVTKTSSSRFEHSTDDIVSQINEAATIEDDNLTGRQKFYKGIVIFFQIISLVGGAVATLQLMRIAIKLMTGIAMDKADFKSQILPWFLGDVVLITAGVLAPWFIGLCEQWFSNQGIFNVDL